MGANDAKRSWPAVSQISYLMVLSPTVHFWVKNAAPMVGSLFSWKSLLTKRKTSDDLPTAASPRRTNLTEVAGAGKLIVYGVGKVLA